MGASRHKTLPKNKKQKTKKWLQEGINNDKGDLYKQQRDS